MSTTATELKRKLSRQNSTQLQSKLKKGELTAAEAKIAQEILDGRGIAVAEEKPKKETGKKSTAETKEGKEKTSTPKKPKVEKVGETKSDIMRRLLREGKTTKEIIEHFTKLEITVRYPEIRRNRMWLEEKEEWVNPHKVEEAVEA